MSSCTLFFLALKTRKKEEETTKMLTKKKRTALVLAVILSMLLLVFTGCGPQAGDVEGKPSGEAKPKRISVATGGTGGTYYPYGGAVASIINKYVSNSIGSES